MTTNNDTSPTDDSSKFVGQKKTDLLKIKDFLHQKGIEFDTNKDLDAQLRSRLIKGIINDVPTTKDTLGFQPLVLALSNIVLSPSTATPITIAIEGEWGSGKTSFLKMIEKEAKYLGYPSIWLNAWSLEDNAQLRGAIVEQLIYELSMQMDSVPRVRRRVSIFLSFIEPVFQIRDNITKLIDNLTKLVAPLILGRLGKQLNRISQNFREEHDDIEKISYIVRRQKTFQKLVNELLDRVESKGAKVLVCIDDLDRALPDRATEVIRNLSTVLETRNCIFLIAMDAHVVATAIEDSYKKEIFDGSWGRNFLRKIVQIVVPTPKMNRQSVEYFLNQIEIRDSIKEYVMWSRDDIALNPRLLKQHINQLQMLEQMVAISGPSFCTIDTMLKALAFKANYPDLFNDILNGKSIDYEKIEGLRKYGTDDYKYLYKTFDDYILNLKELPQEAFNKYLEDNPAINAVASNSHFKKTVVL